MSAVTDPIDRVETLLAHLLYAGDSITEHIVGGRRFTPDGDEYAEVDASVRLRFAPMKPRLVYTVQDGADDAGERLYTDDPRLLLAPPQEIIGDGAEIAILCHDRVKWNGFRKLRRCPRHVWIGSSGACLYEYHYREIFLNGSYTYAWRVAALRKDGTPALALVEGTRGAAGMIDGEMAVMAASIIEDAHRPNALTATISEHAAIRLPVPIGEHRDLFALRDAPLSLSGRRKAILHWVCQHMRQTRTPEKLASVSAHWRGVRTIEMDGLSVTLEPNAQ